MILHLPSISGRYTSFNPPPIDHEIFSPEYSSSVELLKWCTDNSDITKELFDKYSLEYIDKNINWDYSTHKLDPKYGFLLDELLRTSELEVF